MSEPRESASLESTDWFATTHWSVVRTASNTSSLQAREALEKLCNTYWPPLYVYIRRKGHDEHEAEDLTQEFFARLLTRNDLARLDPHRGRFRAFLLAAMNHFLANEWRKAGAIKRGAGRATLSFNTTTGEQRLAALMAVEATPERLFDRRWAETVLERAAVRLHKEFVRDQREEVFRELNVFLSIPTAAGDYAAVSARLGLSKTAVAKTVERMRRRYRELARDEIAQTVTTPAEVDEEMRYLLEVLK